MIEEEGIADRGTFVIDPEGRVQIVEINAGGIGRDAVRAAAQDQGGPVRRRTPTRCARRSGRKGQATLAPSLDLVGKI
jgi:NADH-dependent peroxiredoxin subunit C